MDICLFLYRFSIAITLQCCTAHIPTKASKHANGNNIMRNTLESLHLQRIEIQIQGTLMQVCLQGSRLSALFVL